MIFENLQYYILGELITCVVSAILCFNIIASFSPYERRHRLFLYSCICCFLAAFFDIISVFYVSKMDGMSEIGCLVSSTLFYIFLLFIPVLMTCYTIEIAFTYKKRNNFLLYSIWTIFTVYLVIILLNLKTGWVFYVDSLNGYSYGPLKNITYILTIVYMLIIEIVAFCYRKSMSGRMYISVFLYPIISALIMVFQFFRPELLLTGAASFSSLLFAYITIQSDMTEYDFLTGLMTQHKLEKHIELKKYDGVLFVVSVENMNFIQINMDIDKYNSLLLKIAQEFTKRFERKSYIISSNRFAAISHSLDDVKIFSDEINDFLVSLNNDKTLHLPVPLEFYSAAEEFAVGEKSFTNVMEIINNLLLKAKKDNTQKLVICDQSILMDMERKKYIYKILKRELFIDSEQFFICYQPIYSIKDNKFLYMEALARLHNTEIGVIPPPEFVQVAENKGLIEQLGNVAFEKICKFIAENRDVVNAVSINFSVYQITNPNIVNNVINTLKKFNLSPSNIIIEITESIFIDNFDIARKNMISLASKGIRFYLDDFGTGYSNLANVIGLPFSTIKIDRSLVLMMEHNEKNFRLFSNLISTFKGADLNILVEGVETQKQNELVRKAGADYIQGYLYSRPVPAKQCIELLKRDTIETTFEST